MQQFIVSGRVIDLVLAIVVLEIATLLACRTGGNRQATAELLAHLCAAAGLLGATHLLLHRAAWPYPALALSAALIAHVAAWRLRWHEPRSMKLSAARSRFGSRLAS